MKHCSLLESKITRAVIEVVNHVYCESYAVFAIIL